MKILFCSHEKFLPLVIGGSIGNLRIVEKMVERGHDVTVATPLYNIAGAPGSLSGATSRIRYGDKKVIEKNYKIRLAPFSPFYIDRYIPYRERKYMLYSFLYLFHFMRLLQGKKYDAVFVRNCVLAVPFLLIKKFCNIPFFLSMTDFLSGFSYQNPKVPNLIVDILFEIERWVGGQFEGTFVITPRMKAELEKHRGISDKIIVTYDGVDIDKFDIKKVDPQDIKRTRKEVGFEKNIVLYHGTIQLDAVTLFEEIIKTTLNKSDVNFVIIGMGKGYSMLEARLNKNPNVKFMGFIKHDDLPRFIAASSVGIIPYKRTFNSNIILTLKMLEFLAMGLPVVSTNLASINDVFSKFSCVKIHDDVNAFSNSILEYLKIERSHHGAIEFIRQHFSWDIVASKMVEEMERFCKSF